MIEACESYEAELLHGFGVHDHVHLLIHCPAEEVGHTPMRTACTPDLEGRGFGRPPVGPPS
ncbi:hypothetical protein E1292_11905 [Nonomuraea deserti]|uniref:Transposase IS200-like domain-containing protein n=2 Tax=Nonomuraea deserti TaxID=1848322 RepID=A0A4R4VZZ5_9ACTN|nr:hypothetical protein E1292_11905 [Nonomuraea deserti]